MTKPKAEGQANTKKKPRYIIPLTSSDDDSEDEKNALKKCLAVAEKYVLTAEKKRLEKKKALEALANEISISEKNHNIRRSTSLTDINWDTL